MLSQVTIIIALTSGLSQAAKYPYWDDSIFNTTGVIKRDTENFWGQVCALSRNTGQANANRVLYRDGGCDGPANYGAYDEKTYSCYNLATDKPWDTLVINTNGGTDVMFFEALDCCTSSSNTPCSIYTGYQRDTCVHSIGSGKTGEHFAKSFAVVPHAYNGNGVATMKSCSAAGGGDCSKSPSDNPPTCKRSNGARDVEQACEDAPNCELWQDEDGYNRVRFVRGMGPDSDWYHQNVRLPEESHQKRQNDCPDDVHYNAERGEGTIQYGFDQEVASTMYDHCQQSTCKTEWKLENRAYINSNGEKDQKTLSLQADGQWDLADKNQRGYFINATVLHGQSSRSDESGYYTGTPDASQPSHYHKGTVYYGTTFINTSRFKNGNLQGFASLTITEDPDDADACEAVKTILQGAVGEVSAIGAGFFGVLGDAICQA